MDNNTIELALMEQEERELVEFILKTIPEADKTSAATPEHPSGYTLTPDDVLFVLDMMDDYLVEQGLLREDPESGEMEYLDGDVDETEQLNYVLNACREEGRAISAVQVQLIQDAELQFGIEHGYYEEEE